VSAAWVGRQEPALALWSAGHPQTLHGTLATPPPRPAQHPLAVHALGTVLRAPSTRRIATMATAAERMRAHRERARRGLRRLTIDVSEDDLRTLAERGYEGAASTDHDQQAQAVGLFLNDSLLEIWPTGSLSQRQP
jgi:hypothetical protein